MSLLSRLKTRQNNKFTNYYYLNAFKLNEAYVSKIILKVWMVLVNVYTFIHFGIEIVRDALNSKVFVVKKMFGLTTVLTGPTITRYCLPEVSTD